MSLIGHTVDHGRYRLLRRIGAGGMGEVYEAEDTVLPRRVAVKTIKSGLDDPDFARRFAREAMIIAQLDHPNIVKIYSYGSENDLSFIVMQYLGGGSLNDRLIQTTKEQRGDLSLRDISNVLRDVAAALDYAHKREVIHRDVKPANIMFDEEGHVFLVDFGIARPSAGAGSETTMFKRAYTPNYAAPEQVMLQKPTPRIDQYALATVAYVMAAGGLPYQGNSEQIEEKKAQEDALLASHYRSQLPKAIVDVLAKGLAREPDKRYSSTGAFAAAFAQAAEAPAGRSPNQRVRAGLIVIVAAMMAVVGILAATLSAGNEPLGTPTPIDQAETSEPSPDESGMIFVPDSATPDLSETPAAEQASPVSVAVVPPETPTPTQTAARASATATPRLTQAPVQVLTVIPPPTSAATQRVTRANTTPSPGLTATPSQAPTAIPSETSATAQATVRASATPSPSLSAVPSQTPTAIPSETPTATQTTVRASATPSPSLTAVPSQTPTMTPSETPDLDATATAASLILQITVEAALTATATSWTATPTATLDLDATATWDSLIIQQTVEAVLTATASIWTPTPAATVTPPPSTTPTPSQTPSPTQTREAAATTTPRQLCPDARISRLGAGDRGEIVFYTGAAINLRMRPGTNGVVVRPLSEGTRFTVIEGPECSVYAWWRVRLDDGLEGWVAEGDADRYFVDPVMVNAPPAVMMRDAGDISVGEAVTGMLQAGEMDEWALRLTGTPIIAVSLTSSHFDTIFMIVDENGGLVGRSDDGGGGTNSFVNQQLQEGIEYRIRVRAKGNQQGGVYTLTVNRGQIGETTRLDSRAAYVPFEHGFAIWTQSGDIVWLFYDTGVWGRIGEYFTTDPDINRDLQAPAGRFVPRNRIGIVWRATDGPNTLGWALREEISYTISSSYTASTGIGTMTGPHGETYYLTNTYTWWQ